MSADVRLGVMFTPEAECYFLLPGSREREITGYVECFEQPFGYAVGDWLCGDGVLENLLSRVGWAQPKASRRKIQVYKKTFEGFIQTVMSLDAPLSFENFVNSDLSEGLPICYEGLSTVFKFPLNSAGEEDVKKYHYRLFVPENLDDLMGYLTVVYLCRGFRFHKCPNCGRYVASATDKKFKYCHRVITQSEYRSDLGRTCKDVGRNRTQRRKINTEPSVALYIKYYKSASYRKDMGQISAEVFSAWGKEARKQRDLCAAGEISYEDLKNWFLANNVLDYSQNNRKDR